MPLLLVAAQQCILLNFCLQIEKVKAATIAAGNWPAATSSNADVKNPPPPPFPAHVDDEDEEGLC